MPPRHNHSPSGLGRGVQCMNPSYAHREDRVLCQASAGRPVLAGGFPGRGGFFPYLRKNHGKIRRPVPKLAWRAVSPTTDRVLKRTINSTWGTGWDHSREKPYRVADRMTNSVFRHFSGSAGLGNPEQIQGAFRGTGMFVQHLTCAGGSQTCLGWVIHDGADDCPELIRGGNIPRGVCFHQV